EALDRLRIPKSFNPRDPRARRDLASTLRSKVPDDGGRRPPPGRAAAADDEAIARLRAEIRAHPCHGCAEREDHARWAERYWRLRAGERRRRTRVANRTTS